MSESVACFALQASDDQELLKCHESSKTMIYYYYCTCVCICVISHVPQHVCDGQRTACRSKFFPSFCNVHPGDGAQVIGVIW